MYTLYYSPGRASMAVHWMLIELGVPFEARLVDFATKAHKSTESVQLNPDGMIPTLVVDRKTALNDRTRAHAGGAPPGRRP